MNIFKITFLLFVGVDFKKIIKKFKLNDTDKPRQQIVHHKVIDKESSLNYHQIHLITVKLQLRKFIKLNNKKKLN